MRLSFRIVTGALGLAVAVLVAFARPAGVASPALAVSVGAIACWATGVLPGAVVALGFFAACALADVAPPAAIFAGFQSTAFWMVFGGFVLGAAIRRTGLGGVLAAGITGPLGRSYAGAIGGIVALGIALSFVMPAAIGRTAMLVPIAAAVAERLGFAPRDRGAQGMAMAAVFGTQAPSFAILPANIPNAVLAANAEALLGHAPSYGFYFLLHFPVLGALKALVLVALLVWAYPARLPERSLSHQPVPALTGEQARLAALLVVTLALWVTDFLHHISPGWIALAAGVACLLPPVRGLSAGALDSEINHSALLHVAGLIGLAAVVSASGLGAMMARAVLGVLPLDPATPLASVAILAGLAMVVAVLTTVVGLPAVLTPLAPDLAAASGLPVETVLMTQVLGFSTVLAPYQSAPLTLGLHMVRPSTGPLLRFWVAFTLATLVLLLPLDLLWWRILGMA